jgi:hypothetical protein
MSRSFTSVEEAFLALADPARADWTAAFGFLAGHPDTAQAMLEAFADTLRDLGVTPGGQDPQSGEPIYTLSDVAQAMGIPEGELERAVQFPPVPGEDV